MTPVFEESVRLLRLAQRDNAMKVLGWAVQCLELASGDHPDAGDREQRS